MMKLVFPLCSTVEIDNEDFYRVLVSNETKNLKGKVSLRIFNVDEILSISTFDIFTIRVKLAFELLVSKSFSYKILQPPPLCILEYPRTAY